MNRKNVEYLVAGGLALYVVFLTRPAPYVVTNLLASPVVQVAALALVIYVGAKLSMLVAVVLALALVLSMPSREHMTASEKNKLDSKEKDAKKKNGASKNGASKNGASKLDSSKPPSAPAPAAPAAPKPSSSNLDAVMNGMNGEKEPAPGANDVATSTDAKGSEKFSLMNAAPF